MVLKKQVGKNKVIKAFYYMKEINYIIEINNKIN
jgi:hypothetical protein